MADMRLDDWITIGATALKLVAFGLSVMILIAAWPHIVSIVSRLSARARNEGAARRAYRQRVYDRALMPSRTAIAGVVPSGGSDYSAALDRTSEHAGSVAAFPVPALWEQIGTLSDDDLLDVLARVKAADGKPKYADSRIAKFIGGRVEDRVAQVRDVRGTEPPPPKPDTLLRVRDNGLERLIAKYGK